MTATKPSSIFTTMTDQEAGTLSGGRFVSQSRLPQGSQPVSCNVDGTYTYQQNGRRFNFRPIRFLWF